MSYYKAKLIVPVLAVVIGIVACDSMLDGTQEALMTTGTDVITGIVVDQEHNELENAEVINSGNVLATTNADGVFSFDKSEISDSDVMTFNLDGFATVSKIYSEDLMLKIIMKERPEAVEFNAADGEIVELESGLELDFPADAFELDGVAYDGTVNIVATYFDPENTRDLLSAPAPVVAQDGPSGDLIPLSTFGMLEVLAFTPDNEDLQLAPDVTVDINFPAIDGTPGEVNLYELDAESGYWAFSSTLELSGTQLQGVITSVNTAWNADEPCADQLVCVKVKVEFTDPLMSCGIGATGVSYQGFDGIKMPDANGEVELMVCPDEVFELGACWILCCGPGTPQTDPCCNNPQKRKTIDMSTVTLNPNGCTDLGVWIIN